MSHLIVIPVFDEAATIARVVEAARAHGPVLVIDDGSRDDSAALAAAAGADVLRHPRRLGKAQALLTGIAAARRRSATLVVTLDGDGQHDPGAIPVLLAAARGAGRAVVVGNRLDGHGRLPVTRRNAIRVASFFASWVSGAPVADSQSGFRVYPLGLFDEVRTCRGGFVFETEILLAAAAAGWGIEQVGVPALPRIAARSRFRPIRDGAAIGAFLAARALTCWSLEARTLAAELLAVFQSEHMAARHAAILEAASAYTDSPVRWSLAVGAAAARRAGARLAAVGDNARRRGTDRAVVATLAAPFILPLLLLVALAGERSPDLVTPLVDALYGTPRRTRFEVDAVGVGADAMTESGG
ncbi:MAG: glycosyltransferase family 2 protein [Candidatus Rokuibacteriota bacterium]|nr:MAG: glycosyltransferase family 2 protein [Candidatus Rokubacteria bacterium]